MNWGTEARPATVRNCRCRQEHGWVHWTLLSTSALLKTTTCSAWCGCRRLWFPKLKPKPNQMEIQKLYNLSAFWKLWQTHHGLPVLCGISIWHILTRKGTNKEKCPAFPLLLPAQVLQQTWVALCSEAPKMYTFKQWCLNTEEALHSCPLQCHHPPAPGDHWLYERKLRVTGFSPGPGPEALPNSVHLQAWSGEDHSFRLHFEYWTRGARGPTLT